MAERMSAAEKEAIRRANEADKAAKASAARGDFAGARAIRLQAVADLLADVPDSGLTTPAPPQVTVVGVTTNHPEPVAAPTPQPQPAATAPKPALPTVKIGKRTFTILFPDLLRPLTDNERQTLKNSIRKHGVLSPIVVDEQDGIIDGANRAELASELKLGEVPVRVRPEAMLYAKMELALDLNDARRHLSPAERRRLKEERVEKVAELRRQGVSTRDIAAEVGIDQKQVRRDLEKAATEDMSSVEPAGGKVMGRDGKERPPRRQPKAPPASPPTAQVTLGADATPVEPTVESSEGACPAAPPAADPAGPQQEPARRFTQEEINAIDNPGILVNNQQAVESLQRAVISAPRDLRMVRDGLSDLLRSRGWMDRLDPRGGRRHTYQGADQFLAFVRDPLPKGLDTTPEMLRRLLADDPEALALFEAAAGNGATAAEAPPAAAGKATSPYRSFADVAAPLLAELDHFGRQGQLAQSPSALLRIAEELRRAVEALPDINVLPRKYKVERTEPEKIHERLDRLLDQFQQADEKQIKFLVKSQCQGWNKARKAKYARKLRCMLEPLQALADRLEHETAQPGAG